MKRFVIYSCLIISLGVILGPLRFSYAANDTRLYPKLANYFLHWEISDKETIELAKWDLLILDMETQVTSRSQLEKIRALNPKIIILAYISSQEIMNEPGFLDDSSLRKKLLNNIYSGWWLKDLGGQRISFWPGASMLNLSDGAALSGLGQRFNDYLPEFVNENIKNSGLWDGIFYDNLWGSICWNSQSQIDLNNNGSVLNCAEMNEAWSNGVKKMLSESRALLGDDYIISGNGQVYSPYFNYLNGLMIEEFPSSWENNGSWLTSINNYFSLNDKISRQPQLNIINRRSSYQEDYKSFRYGLASALLGDAYFSMDRGVTDHGQFWWYDEYGINLGAPRSKAYNLFATSSVIKTGLWRRDFAGGLALVNSSDQPQKIIFSKEELERIKGTQDPKTNDGSRVNWLSLAPGDGLILLKSGAEIFNSNFNNGNFVRVYDEHGQTVKNGFFAYLPSFPGDQEIITIDFNEDGQLENITNRQGKIEIYRQGKVTKSFAPFTAKYQGRFAFAYAKSNIITAANGQIRIFDLNAKLLGVFTTPAKGSLSLAATDNNIVVASADPQIRVYDYHGRLLKEILAYGPGWRGGINVAAGDINNDGQAEIVTGPRAGGGPDLKVFSLDGNLLAQFLAYDKNFLKGIKPSLTDVNSDGNLEILVGIKNF